MYIAIAARDLPKRIGEDLELMKQYVDKSNENYTYNKYCLFEMDQENYERYHRQRTLYNCKYEIIYDPENAASKVLASIANNHIFVRHFGTKS